jgi:hypothetical protein
MMSLIKYYQTETERMIAIQLTEDTFLGGLVCTLGYFTTFRAEIRGWCKGFDGIDIKISNTGDDKKYFCRVNNGEFIICDFNHKQINVMSYDTFMKLHNHKYKDTEPLTD